MKIFSRVIMRGTLEDDLTVRLVIDVLRHEDRNEFWFHDAKLPQFHWIVAIILILLLQLPTTISLGSQNGPTEGADAILSICCLREQTPSHTVHSPGESFSSCRQPRSCTNPPEFRIRLPWLWHLNKDNSVFVKWTMNEQCSFPVWKQSSTGINHPPFIKKRNVLWRGHFIETDLLVQISFPMESQSDALASFTHYIEYYGEQIGDMKILGKLITDVASLVKKSFICISETYFGSTCRGLWRIEMSKNGIHMLYLPCSITFDGDFDRNSVSFLVRIYPLRISRQGPDIILNEEESRNCVVLNMIRSSLL